MIAQLEDDDESNDPEAFTSVVMDANTPWKIDQVTDKGTYTLQVSATPVLEDGTMFTVPDPKAVSLDAFDITETFDLQVLDLANATDEEKQEAAKAAEASAEASGDETKAEAVNNTVSKNVPAYTPSHNASAGGGSSHAGNTGGGSGGGNASSSTQPSKPVHVHNWVAHYSNVQVASQFICSCGAVFSSTSEIAVHQQEMLIAGVAGHGSSTNRPVFEQQIDYYYCTGCGAVR